MTTPDDAHHERVIYRSEEEFNKALDAAAEKLSPGNRVWWVIVALFVLLGAFTLGRWIFGLDLRRSILPGVDLLQPLLMAIVILFIVLHARTRSHHDRIINGRLCLGCGTSLAGVPVDGTGDGACPSCGRSFNLGEYRRPIENRGRNFHGYLDEKHFEKTIERAAEQIRAASGAPVERKLLDWSWTALGIGFLLNVVGWDLLEWIPGPQPNYLIILGLLAGWSGIYWWRVSRVQAHVVDHRLCFNCGFCLLHTATDDHGIGRCSECGEAFDARQYVRPDPADDASA